MKITYILLPILLLSLSACSDDKHKASSSSEIIQTSATEETQQYPLYPLKEGKFAVIKNAKLGPQVQFLSEVDDIICHQLIVESQSVGWIYFAHQAGTQLLLYKCEILEGKPFSPESKYGERNSFAIFEALKRGKKWTLSKLPIPDYDKFSNHSLCNTKIAYWASNNNVHFASIYDLEKKQVTEKEKSADFELRTDNEGYFPQPIWNKGCNKVVFPKYYESKKDISINLKN